MNKLNGEWQEGNSTNNNKTILSAWIGLKWTWQQNQKSFGNIIRKIEN